MTERYQPQRSAVSRTDQQPQEVLVLLRNQIQQLPNELTQNIVEYLCGHNQRINEPSDETCHTPLMDAIIKNDFSLVVTMVEVFPKYFGRSSNLAKFDVNFRNSEGDSATLLASSLGKFHTVKYLMFHGANVNVSLKKTGDTPLLYACSQNYYPSLENFRVEAYDIAQHLINHGGADLVNSSYRSGVTPLHVVSKRRGTANAKSVELLIQEGADTNATDFFGNSTW